MSYCPLMSYAKQYAQEIPCLGEECVLAADGAGECLIKQALALYVSKERTRRTEEEEQASRETELAKMYWAMKKDGTRSSIQFLQDGDMTPYTPPIDMKPDPNYPKIDMYDESTSEGIRWAHRPSTEKYPHGGWFEDLSNLRKESE